MDSERQKREKEIERLMRGADLSRERDVAFQEEVRKAASAIIEEEASRIQKSERAERRKRSISPMTAGLWLIVIGAGLALSIPSLGALLIVCGIAAVVWAKSSKK
jgi:CHASE3 domain sensor protein